MIVQPGFGKCVIIVHRCIQEIAAKFNLLPFYPLQLVGEGPAAAADQFARKPIASLQARGARQQKTVYFQQEGVFLENRELPHVEGAQLGQGLDPEPGQGSGKPTNTLNGRFISARNGIEQQKIRQSRIYDHITLIFHA